MAKSAGLRSIVGEGGTMHNYEFGSWGASRSGPGGEPEGDPRQKHSTFSLIVMIAVVAVLAILGLGIAFWLLGFLFHLAGWILRVAVLAAVAAFVWRRITRRRSSERI
jgi:hypothetical protein